MNISAKTKICMIIGDPVDHSLSPAMHNEAYKHLHMDGQYVYLGANIKIERLKDVVNAVRALNIRGLTCTIPHKVKVLKYIDEVDKIAHMIGAANTIVNTNGVLKGYNTDWLGVATPLEEITNLKNKNISVIGAGGASRAIVYGMKEKGAKVTIYNRTIESARRLAHEFDSQTHPIQDYRRILESDIVINTTSVGMGDLEGQSPIPESALRKGQIVFDIVYTPYETELLKMAKRKGAYMIHGMEMLLYQGTAQFELYTGIKAPVEVMRKTLISALSL